MMSFRENLLKEMDYLADYKNKAITISTTAKHATDYLLLPRRYALNTAISNFLISDSEFLKDTLRFFDGKVDTIFIDIEQKQEINLFKIAKDIVNQSQLIAVKPNDTSLESCDLLIRDKFHDDLIDKNALIIGTGNLASKIALRLAERQANVYLKGRTKQKENTVVDGLNSFLPKFSTSIKTFDHIKEINKVDVIVSFLSGQFEEEKIVCNYIDKNTFVVDGGISNFSRDFVTKMLNQHTTITRLDARIALPYQFLSTFDYTTSFFDDVYGKSEIYNIPIVSGGFIGSEGMVIVDNINQPNQIIGIADGSGGVKKNEQLNKSDSKSIQKIEQAISTSN